MTDSWLRLTEHVHGHLACLSTVALVHPAVLLRNPRRRALSSALAATLLVTCSAALGLLLYPPYRTQLKPLVFAVSSSIGLAFERKEHLAMAVVVLAWVGLVAHYADCKDRSLVSSTWSVAQVAYTGAAALALTTAILGVAVAVHRTF